MTQPLSPDNEDYVSPPGKNERQYVMVPVEEYEALRRPAQCARADIAKAIAYDLENGSAHGARVVTTPHLDNYHVTGHVNLLALADAVLALSSTDGCARCGFPKSEHHYNGAAYGVCGDYT